MFDGASGSPVNSAADSSARYSRERLMPICSINAATGARKANSSAPSTTVASAVTSPARSSDAVEQAVLALRRGRFLRRETSE